MTEAVTRRHISPFLASPQIPCAAAAPRRTQVSSHGASFRIDGKPTYRGRSFRGLKVEGLLINLHMVQGIFEDRNPATLTRWAYPDTGKWEPKRNTAEFIAAIPEWPNHGVLSFSLNLQGGSPEGYSKSQPWDTGEIAPDGSLREDFMHRLQKIFDRATELGMLPILGIYSFGQDRQVLDEAAVKRSVDLTVYWILEGRYRNVPLKISNECNIAAYGHAILKALRGHELIERARAIHANGHRLSVGVSYAGNTVALLKVVKSSKFLLIHRNGLKDPLRIAEMMQQSRRVEGYRPMPILFNEDNHFDFNLPSNNRMATIGEYASLEPHRTAFFNLTREVAER